MDANEFRGDVCMELRHRGYDDLADAFAGVSDEKATELHEDVDGDEVMGAQHIIEGWDSMVAFARNVAGE